MRHHHTPREELSPRAQIDKLTRQLVMTMRPLLEESASPAPRTRPIDGHAAEAFYRSRTAELEGLGFRLLGDYDATDVDAERDLFTRLMLSDDGGTYAKILASPDDDANEGVEAIAFGTSLADRSSVTTWLNWPPRIPSPARFQEWFIDGAKPLDTVLAAHRTHVQRTGQPVMPFADGAAILEEWQYQERETIAWRKRQGMRFYEMFIRNITGENFDTSGVLMLESIRAHPWWLTGGRAA